MTSLKLFVLALVAAFFVLGEADFATLQQQVEDELAMTKSRFSNFELFLKEEHNAKDLYQEVKKKCDDVEHQFDLLVVEIVKLKEENDVKDDAFKNRVQAITKILAKERDGLDNLLTHKDKKGEIEKMLHDKITHDIIISRLEHGGNKFDDFVRKLMEFEEFANKP
ncbi:hypothetical protein Ddc_10565 [Ditylenchus destructor]|nr:hypothetical protein Ddc_10565 [Ditylenchus destructor]